MFLCFFHRGKAHGEQHTPGSALCICVRRAALCSLHQALAGTSCSPRDRILQLNGNAPLGQVAEPTAPLMQQLHFGQGGESISSLRAGQPPGEQSPVRAHTQPPPHCCHSPAATSAFICRAQKAAAPQKHLLSQQGKINPLTGTRPVCE